MKRTLLLLSLSTAVACVSTRGDGPTGTAAISPVTDGGSGSSPSPPSSVGAGAMLVCPAGGIEVGPLDDVTAIVAGAPEGATICIRGAHLASATVVPKAGQTLLGVDPTASISGARVLADWTPRGASWVNSGVLSATPHVAKTISPGHDACSEVSTYQDDVFYAGKRMLRVLTVAQVDGRDPSLPAGQATTPVEIGRFATDYANREIVIDQDPTATVVEVAWLDTLVSSKAANVTLKNLVLEKALTSIVESGKSWTIEDCTIRFAHNVGVRGGGGDPDTRFTYRRDSIVQNGQFGISSGGSFITVEDTELAWNNLANYRTLSDDGTSCASYWGAGASKFVRASGGSSTNPSLLVTGLDSHDNVGTGFWTDIRNQFVQVENSHFHDNESYGYMHEISCDIDIGNNEFDHNGRHIKNHDMAGGGVLISDSNDANIHDNYIHDNVDFAVLLNFQPAHTGLAGLGCLGAADDADTSHALSRNVVTGNDVTMCTNRIGARGDAVSARSNRFDGNRYRVRNLAASWWLDGTTRPTWGQWQAAGEDASGTIDSADCP